MLQGYGMLLESILLELCIIVVDQKLSNFAKLSGSTLC